MRSDDSYETRDKKFISEDRTTAEFCSEKRNSMNFIQKKI